MSVLYPLQWKVWGYKDPSEEAFSPCPQGRTAQLVGCKGLFSRVLVLNPSALGQPERACERRTFYPFLHVPLFLLSVYIPPVLLLFPFLARSLTAVL